MEPDSSNQRSPMQPDCFFAYSILGLTYGRLGRYREAILETEKGRELSESPFALALLAQTYAEAGKMKQAHQVLGELLALSRRGYVCGYNVATVYAALGDSDSAFQWLERAFLQRSD